MRSVESFEYLHRSLAEPGEYAITTANGIVYRVIVGPGGSSDLLRRREQAPRDPEYGMASNELYGDDQAIPLLDWRAFRDVRGAVFMFYAEGARQVEHVEDYLGTVRHTSAVVDIEHVEPGP